MTKFGVGEQDCVRLVEITTQSAPSKKGVRKARARGKKNDERSSRIEENPERALPLL